jgi:LuxR family maltose regulon positive regulatory protein
VVDNETITPVLQTKLCIAPARPDLVLRPRLIERLNEGLWLGRQLTLISAPAGCGKTTLLSEWAVDCGRPVAWLSLDEGDDDLVRFLAYLVAALRMIPGLGKVGVGESALAMLRSPQPPSVEAILTSLINEMTTISIPFILVLDDHHLICHFSMDQSCFLWKGVLRCCVPVAWAREVSGLTNAI